MIKSLFWDLDPHELQWERDREQIIGRVLAAGSWDAVTWLRKRAGDDALREWIQRHQGRGLTPRQLRFWELIFELPHRQVNAWLRSEGRQVWDRRTSR
jgi:hypothetical protein